MYCGFPRNGWADQVYNSLNNFSGLWGVEDAPICLMPSPGKIRAGD